MEFEISGFTTPGPFSSSGPGKVLPFYPGPLSAALIKALTDHAMLNVCVV